MWVGDYTMQPENGGLGVFAHEYGHDLGLPDNYDTSGGDNGTGFWDLMSAGSYLGPGVEDLGARPGDMTAWDKFQLGWLNYEVSSLARSLDPPPRAGRVQHPRRSKACSRCCPTRW